MHSLPIAGAYNTSTLPAPCPLGFDTYTPLTKTSLQARMKWGRIFDMVRCFTRQVSIYATCPTLALDLAKSTLHGPCIDHAMVQYELSGA